MTKISVQEAEAKFSELIHALKPGDEVVITEGERPIARLTCAARSISRRLGTLKGTVTYMSSDFDEPLEEFREYMQ